MILSDISVKRPVFAAVISLLLVAFGILSADRLPVREYPDIDPPVVSINTIYKGASAATVETRVTQIIEDQVAGIEGVRWLASESSDGLSRVTMEFNLDRNVDDAANDVRDRVSRVLNNLPEETEPPEVFKVDSDEDAIVWYNLQSATMDSLELTDYADRYIVDRLSAVDGVARVRIGGAQFYAMRIWLDRVALAARGLTAADVESALRAENVELPAGAIESEQRDFTLRMARWYRTEDDFRKLVVGRDAGGYLIRLGEVARVELAAEEPRVVFHGNGDPQVGLGIVKQSTANTLEVARATRKEIDRIKPTLPEGTDIYYSYDSSVFISEAINEVYKTLAIAIALVIAVIYLFLGSARATIVPAVTVPVSLISTFSLLYMFGFSINLLTLLAMVLAIGLVVDDSIVVLENIYRRVQKGEHPLLAAFRGARQVGFAVIATTLVLISVFTPILFLESTVGRIFAELAMAVSASVAISSIVALSLCAMLASRLIPPRGETKGRLQAWTDGIMEKMSGAYRRALEAVIAVPVLMGGLVVTVIAAIVVIGARVPSELVPPEDRGAFFVQINGPDGAGFDYTRRQLASVEEILLPYIDKGEARRVLLRAPASFRAIGNFDQAFGIIVLEDWDKRDRSTEEIMTEINQKISEQVPGANVFLIARRGLGGGGGGMRPVQFVVGAPTYDDLSVFRDAMMDRVREMPGLIGPDPDYKETTPQIEVQLDQNRAADLGVSVEEVGRTLETMMGSRKVTTFLRDGEEYDVILQSRRDDRMEVNDLSNIYVRSATSGTLVPLSNIISLRSFADSDALYRYNRVRAVTISAGLASDYSLGQALADLGQVAGEVLPAEANIDYKGESLEFVEAGDAVYFSFAIALVVVFLVLAAQFESFIHPFVIMLAVPLAILGAILGLWIFDSTLNIYSQVGIIILVGIAAKNGILLVEFANQLRDAGRDVHEAILEASQIRLRPIIMTALSTVIGTLPLVMATGAGSEARVTLGIAVFSGVFVATGLTLFVVPVFYRLLAPFTRSPHAVSRELKSMQEAQA